MNRSQLEHLVRAAAAIIGAEEFVVIGSQAILGSYSDAVLPDPMVASVELDLIALADDSLDAQAAADLIDGSLGEHSMFHETFGVYAQGVDLSTAVLPDGWESRLVPVALPGREVTAWCIEPHDLCVSKLIAGRPKDSAYVEAAVRFRLVDPATLMERLDLTADPAAHVERARGVVDRLTPLGVAPAERAKWLRGRSDSDGDRRSATDQTPPTAKIEALRQERGRAEGSK